MKVPVVWRFAAAGTLRNTPIVVLLPRSGFVGCFGVVARIAGDCWPGEARSAWKRHGRSSSCSMRQDPSIPSRISFRSSSRGSSTTGCRIRTPPNCPPPCTTPRRPRRFWRAPVIGKLVPVEKLVLIEGVGPTAIPPARKPTLIEVRKALGIRQSPFGVETLRKLIERRLGKTARVRPSEVQSMQSLLEQEPTPRARREQHEREQADLAAEPEVQAAIRNALRSHYRSWVDQKLPALGNRTPRKAVRDPDGREAVEALVAQLKRDGARMNPPLDREILRELRATLGLS